MNKSSFLGKILFPLLLMFLGLFLIAILALATGHDNVAIEALKIIDRVVQAIGNLFTGAFSILYPAP